MINWSLNLLTYRLVRYHSATTVPCLLLSRWPTDLLSRPPSIFIFRLMYNNMLPVFYCVLGLTQASVLQCNPPLPLFSLCQDDRLTNNLDHWPLLFTYHTHPTPAASYHVSYHVSYSVSGHRQCTTTAYLLHKKTPPLRLTVCRDCPRDWRTRRGSWWGSVPTRSPVPSDSCTRTGWGAAAWGPHRGSVPGYPWALCSGRGTGSNLSWVWFCSLWAKLLVLSFCTVLFLRESFGLVCIHYHLVVLLVVLGTFSTVSFVSEILSVQYQFTASSLAIKLSSLSIHFQFTIGSLSVHKSYRVLRLFLG